MFFNLPELCRATAPVGVVAICVTITLLPNSSRAFLC